MSKYTIREGVWETNSSSVHSITINPRGLRKCNLKPQADGYIHIPLRYFGKDEHTYKSQKDKLSYLLTCVAYMASCGYGDGDYERYYDDYHFKCVEDAIRHYIESSDSDYTILGIKVDHLDKAELDHQSIPEYGEFPIDVNIWDEKSIQNFVFNSYVYLHTDCD